MERVIILQWMCIFSGFYSIGSFITFAHLFIPHKLNLLAKLKDNLDGFFFFFFFGGGGGGGGGGTPALICWN